MPINKVQTGDLLTSTKWNELVTELNKKEKLSEDTFSGALTITESLNAKNATFSETLTAKTATISEGLTAKNATVSETLTVKTATVSGTLTVDSLTVAKPINQLLTVDQLKVTNSASIVGGLKILGANNLSLNTYYTDILRKTPPPVVDTTTEDMQQVQNQIQQLEAQIQPLQHQLETVRMAFGGLPLAAAHQQQLQQFQQQMQQLQQRLLQLRQQQLQQQQQQQQASFSFSIAAAQRIAASEFNAWSDARIKQKLRISNSKEDLATLMQLKVTDYTMIDTVSNGNRVSKKLIAQEVAAVYPNAVSYTTGFIPNIYQIAQIENGFVTLSNPDLTIGDKVRLIFQEQQLEVRVTEITENGFSVLADPPKSKLPNGRVFVFGKEVHDFHSLDYDAITMLNVSATQALVKQLHGLESQHADLKADFEALEKQLQSFKAETILNS